MSEVVGREGGLCKRLQGPGGGSGMAEERAEETSSGGSRGWGPCRQVRGAEEAAQ